MVRPQVSSIVCALTFLSALGEAGCGAATPKAESPDSESGGGGAGGLEIGQRAPDLTIQTLNGKGDVGLEGLTGKVVIVDFWATWCEPCRKSFPALDAIAKRHQGQVTVVGVSVNDEQDGVAEFAKELGTTFPIGWDKGHVLAHGWNVTSMPSTYVLDGKGNVRYVHAGYRDGEEETLEAEISGLLGKGDDAPSPKPNEAVAEKKPEKPDPPPADTTAAAAADTGASASPAPPHKKASKAKRPAKKRATKKKRKAPAATS